MRFMLLFWVFICYTCSGASHEPFSSHRKLLASLRSLSFKVNQSQFQCLMMHSGTCFMRHTILIAELWLDIMIAYDCIPFLGCKSYHDSALPCFTMFVAFMPTCMKPVWSAPFTSDNSECSSFSCWKAVFAAVFAVLLLLLLLLLLLFSL